jgi:hypothetical protein
LSGSPAKGEMRGGKRNPLVSAPLRLSRGAAIDRSW